MPQAMRSPAIFALTLLAFAAPGGAAPPGAVPAPASRAPVLCTASVMHPIQVSVVALDPVRRGGDLRLRVSASSRLELGRAQVRMLSDGGAPRRGASALALGALAPGQAGSGTFTVNVPRSGNRFYVQFEVSADGPQGRLTRGACYNLLPDGPLESGRVVSTPEGRRVMEVAARRID